MAKKIARDIVLVTDSLTRPADTDAYTAGDVIDAAAGAGLIFANCARGEGMGGTIQTALFFDSANVAAPPDVELWLFSATLAGFDNDNDVFTPTDADYYTLNSGVTDSLIGVIPFATANAFVGDATSGTGGNLFIPASRTFLPLEFVCATNGTSLFGVLVVRNAYAPISAETFRVLLTIDRS